MGQLQAFADIVRERLGSGVGAIVSESEDREAGIVIVVGDDRRVAAGQVAYRFAASSRWASVLRLTTCTRRSATRRV